MTLCLLQSRSLTGPPASRNRDLLPQRDAVKPEASVQPVSPSARTSRDATTTTGATPVKAGAFLTTLNCAFSFLVRLTVLFAVALPSVDPPPSVCLPLAPLEYSSPAVRRFLARTSCPVVRRYFARTDYLVFSLVMCRGPYPQALMHTDYLQPRRPYALKLARTSYSWLQLAQKLASSQLWLEFR